MTPVTILTHGKWQLKHASYGLLTIRRSILAHDPDAVVLLGGWQDDHEAKPRRGEPADMAERLADRIAALGCDVNAASHSWGGWFQAVLLFPALDRRGVKVKHATFADPVGRKPLSGDLVIGSNVLTVSRWQKARTGAIRTSELIVTPPTVWLRDETVATNHASVDECAAFQELVVKLAVTTSNLTA